MTIARRQQLSLDQTTYYHCTTRCVRRAFLCGKDSYSGKSFNHRRQWLEDRLTFLSSVFAIDLLAYAIMSNHYHVVVHIDADAAASWSEQEVIDRWGRVFAVSDELSPEYILSRRDRLADLSWYMRCLNEPLARQSNREDSCKGRFWEGRFRCQALLDEQALLKCMVYVDLKPIRAAIAASPESSDYTAVKARLERKDGHLMAMQELDSTSSDRVPILLPEYLELVDWTGRQIDARKRGRMSARLPPILERLNISQKHWIDEMVHYGRWYFRAVGSLASLEQYCRHLGQQWLKGQRYAAIVAT